MNKLTTLLVVAVIALQSSCKKDKSDNASHKVEIDGKSYKTVEIGNQVWTAENYAGSGGIATSNASHGRLYTRAEANSVSLPTEWRLPTGEDYEALLLVLGGSRKASGEVDANASVTKKLMSKTDWTYSNGNNASGFNAFPAGIHRVEFEGMGTRFSCWTSSKTQAGYELIFDLGAGADYEPESGLGDDDFSKRNFKMSVRFVRDK